MNATNLTVTAPSGKRILGPITVEFAPSEWTAVIGPNGAGKTTLCNALVGAVGPASGHIERPTRIGYLAQAPLRPAGLSALEYVLIGNHAWRPPTQIRIEVALSSLEQCHVRPDQDVATLSGGEFRRAGIARLIANETDVLILDEPTAGLDAESRIEMFNLLDRVRGDRAAVTVMHDLAVAAQYADRFIVMDEGAIVASGRRDEVIRTDVLQATFGRAVTVLDVDGEQLPVIRR